jgi:hypothetical protein
MLKITTVSCASAIGTAGEQTQIHPTASIFLGGAAGNRVVPAQSSQGGFAEESSGCALVDGDKQNVAATSGREHGHREERRPRPARFKVRIYKKIKKI